MAQFGSSKLEQRKTSVAQAISNETINKIFSDHYFESMILLKYEFGWEWEDVLYFVTNQRSNPKELNKDWFPK